MDSPVPNANAAQLDLAHRRLVLEGNIKSGMSWFYLIAILSIVNSVIYKVGGGLSFIVGLGITQLIDGFAKTIAPEFAAGTAGTIVNVIAIILDLLVAGFFALCGFLGQKGFRWVVVIGMVLYALDAVIFIAFGNWLPALFHAYALWGLWRGLKGMNDLAALENANPSPAVPQF